MSHLHSSFSSVSKTVCITMQRESSPYSLPVTIATVTKVISKMVMSIKLKVLSLTYTTGVQSSHEFIRQIFINRQQLLYLGGEGSVWVTRKTQNWCERLWWRKNWLDLKLSDDTPLISSSHCMTWQTTSCPVLFCSHSTCFPRIRLWVLKIYRCEFGYRMWSRCVWT